MKNLRYILSHIFRTVQAQLATTRVSQKVSSFSMRDGDGWKSFDDFRHVCG